MKDFLQKPIYAPDGIVLEDGPIEPLEDIEYSDKLPIDYFKKNPSPKFTKGGSTNFKLTFETISGVAVTLEGSNLENLHLIANKIK